MADALQTYYEAVCGIGVDPVLFAKADAILAALPPANQADAWERLQALAPLVEHLPMSKDARAYISARSIFG